MIGCSRVLRFGGPGAPLVCGVLYLGLMMSSIVWAQQSDGRGNAEDRMLAQGEPPLTQVAADRLIGFFEWALDIRFTRAERAEFQRQRIAEWRSNDAESVKNVMAILEIEGRLQSLDADRRRQAQVEIQRNLLAELGKNPNDETSRLLLAAHRRSHGANSASAIGAAGDETDRAARGGYGGVPTDLVGTWLIGSTSGTTFRDRTTGEFSAPSGDQVSYHILPDGRYEYAGLATQSMYGCTTRLMTYMTGRVSVRGASLTFIPETGKFTSEDNCNRKYNYEKRLPLTPETYNWRIERDQRGLKFCLQNAGVNGCAYKQ